TVTDANSCTATTTGNITQPSALTLALAAGACSSSNNGSLTATFGSGTAPYQVKIDTGAYFTATSPYTFTGLAAGSHTITVTAAAWHSYRRTPHRLGCRQTSATKR